MKMKKILASLLALAMLASLTPSILAGAADETVYTSVLIDQGGAWASTGITGTAVKSIPAIGDNPVYAWDASALSESSASRGKEYRYDITSAPFTYEFNMYADGNAIAWITMGSGHSLMYWDVDGTLYTKSSSSSSLVASQKKYERNKWHHVGITLRSGNRYCIWIDDEFISESGYINTSLYGKIGFSMMAGSYGGKVAYSDIYKYDNTYAVRTDISSSSHDRTNHYINPSNSDELTFDSENNSIIYNDSVADVESLKTKIKEATENVSDIKFYSDEYTSETTNITEVKNALIKSTGDVYYYYKVSERIKTPGELVALKASGNPNIMVVGENVVVMSNPYAIEGEITSDMVIEALTSSGGYTLSYVDSDKNEASVDKVYDGYIKADKEGTDSIYIPIFSEVPESRATNLTYNQAHGSGNDATIIKEERTVAGVTAYVQGFVTKATSGLRRIQFNPASYDSTSGKTNVTFTYVFNMYADGNAGAWVGFGSGYPLFKWDAKGDIYTVSSSSATAYDTTPVMNVERDRWHLVSVTVDKKRYRPIIHIDGNLLQPSYDKSFPFNDKIQFLALCSGGGNVAGDNVLYSNVTYYEGFYTKDGEEIKQTRSTADFAVDTDSNTIYYQNVDVQGLKDAIMANTDASAVKIYADSTMSEEATALTENTYVMATSSNGMRQAYYTINTMDKAPLPEFKFNLKNHVFDVTTKIIKAEKDMILYLASYSDDDTLLEIVTEEIGVDELNVDITVSCSYGSDTVKKVKAFLWYANNKPLSCGMQTVELAPAE